MSDGLVASALLAFVALVIAALLVGLGFGCKAYQRYQKRADANNNVKVSAIQIRNQEQRVKIAKQQAQIRYQKAIGIKRAQDEIQKTLTPLYVKFEMIEALNHIASSGRNNTVIYIPTDPNGMAAVPTYNAGTGK